MSESEINSDGRTVWVNDWSGMCIGRFSSRGVDVHRSGAAQLQGGSQCLDCIHDLPFDKSWDRFVTSMLKHHGVTVDSSLKPTPESRPCDGKDGGEK